MIDQSAAYKFEQQKDWDGLLVLISEWPDVPEKKWYLASYFLLCTSDYQAALEVLQDLLAGEQDCPIQVYLRLGKALHGCDRVEEALWCYLKVIADCQDRKDSWFYDAIVAYGLACLELGLYHHWLQFFSRFRFENESIIQCFYLLAQAYFFLGEWQLGWKMYEFRSAWFDTSLAGGNKKILTWFEGMVVGNSKVLISTDLGLGDFIFFMRFVPRLRAYFHAICIVVPENLLVFASKCNFFDQVFKLSSGLDRSFSWHLPISSICHFLASEHIKPEKMSAYLSVEASPGEWPFPSQYDLRKKPLVAINWSGNRQSESPSLTVRARSVPLRLLEGVQSFQNVDLISVQLGEESAWKASALSRFLHPVQSFFADQEKDIWKTASLLATCDLLITNDTSLAHLGGALGLQTWVMLKQFPSWQWGYEGDSEWYSSIRCFRQDKNFDWNSVVDEIDLELSRFVEDWSLKGPSMLF